MNRKLNFKTTKKRCWWCRSWWL